MVKSPVTEANALKPSKSFKTGLVLIFNAPTSNKPIRPSTFVMIVFSEISTDPAREIFSKPSRFSRAVLPLIFIAPSTRVRATSGSKL